MTPEEWQRVRPILESALALDPSKRSSFLDTACPETTLRCEVDSLLAADEKGRSGFLQSPPAVQLVKGTRVGNYEIQSMLGAGGMGEVYRARDLALRRDVAIKVLPAFVSSDPDRLRRFEEEARAAAALSHPNILAVFQMGTYEGVRYFVSELLEGGTLREQLVRGPMALRRVIDFGIQIAHGLSAAHEKGIVHRDLKPENLFITKDGRAKILDFGLAKLSQSLGVVDGAAVTASAGTEPGVVLGTVGYMAPEQVAGKVAGHHADIFAFGAVLYEMLTTKRAFQKPTSAEAMTAILNEEPPVISQVAPSTPPGLQKIVHRCLEKNPEQRFQSASDLAFALEAVSDSGTVSAMQTSSRQRSQRRVGWIVGAATVLVVAALAAYRFWPRSSTPGSTAKVTQISQWNKPMNQARLSPDGHAVAFVSPVDGIGQVFLMLASGGEPLQLTHDEGDKFVENFSPDGKEVLYRRTLGQDEILAVPTLGGPPRHVASASFMVPSPDGSSMFYVKSDSPGIFRAEKTGLSEETVFDQEHNSLDFINLLLFPGGNDLLAVSRQGNSTNFRFRRINLTSHKAFDLGEVSGSALDVVWDEPGKTVLFSRAVDELTNIWKYNFEDQSLTQITFGAGADFSPMPDPGGKGTYFVNGKSTGLLTAYDVHSKKATDIVSENASQPIISHDGKRVMFVALLAKDRNELWVSNIDGTNKVKLATGESLWTGDWSPDDSHLTFCETEADSSAKNYIIAADSSGVRQLRSVRYDRADSDVLRTSSNRVRLRSVWVRTCSNHKLGTRSTLADRC